MLARITTLRFAAYRLAAPRRSDEGATAVEYGMLVALIAAAIVGTVTALGGQVDAAFTTITTALGGGAAG
jgi:pilus assembly protein Flp/PilA